MGSRSKFSLFFRDAIFRVLAVEQPQAIVLNYAPGPLDTPMIDELLADQRTDPGKSLVRCCGSKKYSEPTPIILNTKSISVFWKKIKISSIFLLLDKVFLIKYLMSTIYFSCSYDVWRSEEKWVTTAYRRLCFHPSRPVAQAKLQNRRSCWLLWWYLQRCIAILRRRCPVI